MLPATLRSRLHSTVLLVAFTLIAPALEAGDEVLEGFTGGSNAAGWSFNVTNPDVIEGHGGNPTSWLRNDFVSSFAPILTSGPTAPLPYQGDYRALGVSQISLDARTNAASFGASGRELSLLLRDTKGTATVNDDDYAYFVGPLVPQVGAGWVHYDFSIPSASTAAVPAGWSGGWVGDGENFRPGVDWNDVITSVDVVEVWWLHPAFFAIIQSWDVGVDNIAFAVDPVAVTDLGQALAGTSGEPNLCMLGSLEPGTPVRVDLGNAAASAPSVLFAGVSPLNLLLNGGTLVPNPDLLIVLVTPPGGSLTLNSNWPSGLPLGFEVYLQWWIQDAGGPQGWSATNALVGTTQ